MTARLEMVTTKLNRSRAAGWPGLVLLGVAPLCSPAWADASATPRAIDVLHYTVRLDPDLENKNIQGRMTLEARTR